MKMCGIFGYIGKSKNPAVTYELASQLLLASEERGKDATGFYGCEIGLDGKILADKEPAQSSNYFTGEVWQKLVPRFDMDLFIGHCRQSSAGVGSEKINKNNHPHFSSDFCTALVHNGRIAEFSALKKLYDLRSDCDSEILLTIFEASEELIATRENDLRRDFPEFDLKIAAHFYGLKDIFSRTNMSQMAVACADRLPDGTRYLYLFRDDGRPLHIVDMKEKLGQVFFFSTPEIWKNAVEACKTIKDYLPTPHKIYELKPLQICFLYTDVDGNVSTKAYKITKSKPYDLKLDVDCKKFFRPSSKPDPKLVITRLTDSQEIDMSKIAHLIAEEKKNIPIEINFPIEKNIVVPEKSDFMRKKFAVSESFESIRHLVSDIETIFKNLIIEGGIKENDLDEIQEYLEATSVKLTECKNYIS